MTFLPVLERELRVAARKRSTFWFRVVAAMVAVVIGAIVIFTYSLTSTGVVNFGAALFSTLTWFAMAAALFSGLFFTADCLSEEKREGTMGFLFLTDLRGYDVVGGKLLTQSLRAFYGLLAVFPVLAMIMLMGGVSGAQFWKTNLALVNALICSLMSGLFVSARSTNAQKALAGTFCVLLLFVGAGPFVDEILGHYKPYAMVTSPVYVLRATYNVGTEFWEGLVLCQCIAWGMFAWTCLTLPRKWQEADRVTTKRGWAHFWKYGSARGRELRRKLIGRNPVLWLSSREQWQTRWLWIGVLTGALVQIPLVLLGDNDSSTKMALTMMWGYLGGLLSFFIYIWTASQATRFFADARKSGFLELLLATPLSVREIIGGNWRAFVRGFGGPVLVLVAVQLSFGPGMQYAGYKQGAKRVAATRVRTSASAQAKTNSAGFLVSQTNSAGSTNATGTAVTTTTTITMPDIPFWIMVATTIASVIGFLFNLAAIYWYGAWMGLSSKSGNIAILKTFVFVMVIPWFAITVIGGIITFSMLFPTIRGGGTSSIFWYPFVSAAVAMVLKAVVDLAFITSSRRKLHARFREQAVSSISPDMALPPVIQPATL